MQSSGFLTSQTHGYFQQIREARSAPTDPCTTLNVEVTKMAIIASFATDFVMLIIMVAGLLCLGYHRESSLALGRFMWNQVG